MLYLYLISRDDTPGYDEWDSAIVVAGSEEEARGVHPGRHSDGWEPSYGWVPPGMVKAEVIGTPTFEWESGTVVLASFNAG